MGDKNCKHQYDVVSVQDGESWLEKLWMPTFMSKSKVIISHCKKCGNVKSDKVKY